MFVCLYLNHFPSAVPVLKTPQQFLTGQTQAISKFLHFLLSNPLYYHLYSDAFLSSSNSEQVGWIGIASHLGNALTYKIVTKQNTVIFGFKEEGSRKNQTKD
jgi:hypothetical protein